MQEAYDTMGLKIEGSAGVALAACAADTEKRGGKKIRASSKAAL